MTPDQLVVTCTVAQFEQLVQQASAKAVAQLHEQSQRQVMALAEVATMLDRHPKSVMKLVKDQGLPCHYISAREPRFIKSEVLQWVQALASTPPAIEGD